MGILKKQTTSEYYETTIKKFYKKYKYYLIGMDIYFHYSILEEITSKEVKVLRNKYPDYDRLTVLTLDNDNNIVNILNDKDFTQTNPVSHSDLKLRFIESYRGITLSINALNYYDKYLVYEIVDGKKELVLISEDFSITSSLLKKDRIYYVESYYGYETHYVLYNKSSFVKSELATIEKKEYKLTVCIPAYNIELYLPRTLDSIILNTFENFKMIIINDESKDNTAKVLEWYDKKYDFIEVINAKWSGPSHVRNRFLDMIDTEYMAFSDADDILSPDMYKDLYRNIVKYDADVAICKTIEKDNFNHYNVVLQIQTMDPIVYDYEQMAHEKINRTKRNIFFVSAVNKIVRTEIAKKVKFIDTNRYEDTGYTPAMYTFANKFVFVPYVMYVWDKRQRQTTGTYSTSYDDVEMKYIYRYFFDGIAYPVYTGKKDNLECVSYTALEELINYYNNTPNLPLESREEFRKKLIKLVNDVDVEHNKYIQNDEKLKFNISCLKNTFTPPKLNVLKDILDVLNKEEKK